MRGGGWRLGEREEEKGQMHKHAHINIYTRAHTCTQEHTCTHTHVHTHRCTTHIHTNAHTHVHIYTHTHLNICTHTHIHTYTYTRIHTYTHTHMTLSTEIATPPKSTKSRNSGFTVSRGANSNYDSDLI